MRHWFLLVSMLLSLAAMAACPTGGSVEITQDDIPYDIDADGDSTTYAICDDLRWDGAGAAITVSSGCDSVIILGSGEGSFTAEPGAEYAIRCMAGSTNIRIERLEFDWTDGSSHAVKVNSDSTVVDSCVFYGSKLLYFEPKSDGDDGIMSNPTVMHSQFIMPRIQPDCYHCAPVSIGAGGSWVHDPVVWRNYIWGDPGDDGSGLSTGSWVGGLIAENTIIVYDTYWGSDVDQGNVNIIKSIMARGTYIEDNYFRGKGDRPEFASIRDQSDGESGDESRRVTIRRNVVISDWQALNVTCDSCVVTSNVAIGGINGFSGGFGFRTSNEVDSLRVESNEFGAYSGYGYRYETQGEKVWIVNNTLWSGLNGAALKINDDNVTGTWRNNLFRSGPGSYVIDCGKDIDDSAISLDFDLFYGGTSSRFIKWNRTNYSSLLAWRNATPHGDDSVQADPVFVTASFDTLRNMKLQRTSPAINAGDTDYSVYAQDAGGSPRVRGEIVDIGGYEFTPIKVPIPQSLSLAPRPE